MINQDQIARLARYWRLVEYGTGIRDLSIQFHDVVTRYQEPQRVYHNLDHLEQVLDHAFGRSVIWSYGKVVLDDAPGLALGLFYHDSIYDPLSKENEKNSSTLMATHLDGSLSWDMHETLNNATEVIEATIPGHKPWGTLQKIAQAADLAILSSIPKDYDEYVRKIRAEYPEVSDKDFRDGRKEVMMALYPKLDQAAQKNIYREFA